LCRGPPEGWRFCQHKYPTLVYQIDLGVTRLIWVGKERTIESFQGFFTMIGDEIASKIVFVCSDTRKPCLKFIREKCSEALHILGSQPGSCVRRINEVAKINLSTQAPAKAIHWISRVPPRH
jgi:transposase